MNFAIPADPRVKIKESEKREKFLNLAKELSVEHESDNDTNKNLST